MEKCCGNCEYFADKGLDGLGRCRLKHGWMGCSYYCEKWQAKENEPVDLNLVPIGLTLAFTVYEPRLQAIEEAIERYVEAGKDIPFEWLKEKSNLIKYFIEEELK